MIVFKNTDENSQIRKLRKVTCKTSTIVMPLNRLVCRRILLL